MQPRIRNIAFANPEVAKALIAVGAAGQAPGLAPELLTLVHLRASQINGCALCVEMHGAELAKAGVDAAKALAVGAWRDSPRFSDDERAALALTEEVTRLSERREGVSDAVWDDAARRFDEAQLGALVTHMALINAWNRLNVATRQVAGAWA